MCENAYCPTANYIATKNISRHSINKYKEYKKYILAGNKIYIHYPFMNKTIQNNTHTIYTRLETEWKIIIHTIYKLISKIYKYDTKYISKIKDIYS